MNDKTIRCTTCQAEFSEAEIKGVSCCPGCGSKGVPCLIADDVTVKINWHELRILSCWAERWAMHIEAQATSSLVTLDCIVQRLQKQHPDKVPLTIRGETEQLRQKYPDVKLTDGEGRPIE